MKPPIILNESSTMDVPGDVNIWDTPEDLLSWIEAIDVENEEYFAFDAVGRLLRLYVPEDGKTVAIEDGESEPAHQPELRRLLTMGLSLDGVASAEWCESASLAELIEKARPIYRYG